jgi:hypothetical protein
MNYLSIESIIPDFITIYDYPDETTNFVSIVRERASHNPDHYNYISDFKAKCLEEIELNSSDEEKRYYKYMFTVLTDDLFEALYYDESKRPYYLYGLKCILEEFMGPDGPRANSKPSKFHETWFNLAFNHLRSLLKKESNFFKIGRCIITLINYIMRQETLEAYNKLLDLIDELIDEESIDQTVFKKMMDNYSETYLRFISNFTNVWRTYRHREEFIRNDLYKHSWTHSACALANQQDGLLSPLSFKDEMAYFLNNCLNYVSDNISSAGLPLLQFILVKNLNQLDTSNVNNFLFNLEYMYFMDDNYQFIKSLPKDNCIALSRDYYSKTLNFCLMSAKIIDSLIALEGFEFDSYDDDVRIMVEINSYVLINYLDEEGVNQQEKALMCLREFRAADDFDEFFITHDIKDFNAYIDLLNKRCVRMKDEDDDDEDKKFDSLPLYSETKKVEDTDKLVYDNFLIDVYTPIKPNNN